ncbi:MAG TPA: hypothetical protein VK590_10140 [Saprospiraceae bacterium]|nr:hypothetical protein [Saprospiraceae bacterium]
MSNIPRPDQNGPENVPLNGFNKTFKVVVLIYDLKNSDNVIDMREIDYGLLDDRRWLGRVSFWAWSRGYSVETMSLNDAEGRV